MIHIDKDSVLELIEYAKFIGFTDPVPDLELLKPGDRVIVFNGIEFILK